MQKLFVTFPDGAAGLGLLLLRLAGGAAVVAAAPRMGTQPWIGWLVTGIVVIALALGFLTMIAALTAATLETAIALSGQFNLPLLEAATIAQLLGLALIGPGAYSLDSRLFGRRRLIFESRQPEDAD